MQEYNEATSMGRDIFGNQILTTQSQESSENSQARQPHQASVNTGVNVLGVLGSAIGAICGFLAGTWIADTVFQLLRGIH